MDAVDRKILAVVQEDASLSVAEIGQRIGVSWSYEQSGLRSDEVGNRSSGRADHGQSARERFGDDHSVGFVKRGVNEKIRGIVQLGQRGSVHFARECHASLETVVTQHVSQHSSQRRMALDAAGARQAPAPVAKTAERGPTQTLASPLRRRRHSS